MCDRCDVCLGESFYSVLAFRHKMCPSQLNLPQTESLKINTLLHDIQRCVRVHVCRWVSGNWSLFIVPSLHSDKVDSFSAVDTKISVISTLSTVTPLRESALFCSIIAATRLPQFKTSHRAPPYQSLAASSAWLYPIELLFIYSKLTIPCVGCSFVFVFIKDLIPLENCTSFVEI